MYLVGTREKKSRVEFREERKELEDVKRDKKIKGDKRKRGNRRCNESSNEGGREDRTQ